MISFCLSPNVPLNLHAAAVLQSIITLITNPLKTLSGCFLLSLLVHIYVFYCLKDTLLYWLERFTPSIFHNDKVISNFIEKTNLFSSYFTSQYTHLISNSSVLPDISFHTNARQNSPKQKFSITEKDIFALIKLLDPNKSHGLDNISIKMIKIWGESLVLRFDAALNDGVFPDN